MRADLASKGISDVFCLSARKRADGVGSIEPLVAAMRADLDAPAAAALS